ncbi:MAG: HEPN domain-containing protein [Oscillospiraceae bacterium]|nr:HEPN domain-containing protein [Oscillospiraceae bacterium]
MPDKTKYWLELCDDDLLTAEVLLEKQRLLHMGFFCHLVAEKALKAVIASQIDANPPHIHNLTTLASRSGVSPYLSENQLSLLEQLNPLQIEARYPEYKGSIAATLTYDRCRKIYSETEGFLCWIKQRLGK